MNWKNGTTWTTWTIFVSLRLSFLRPSTFGFKIVKRLTAPYQWRNSVHQMIMIFRQQQTVQVGAHSHAKQLSQNYRHRNFLRQTHVTPQTNYLILSRRHRNERKKISPRRMTHAIHRYSIRIISVKCQQLNLHLHCRAQTPVVLLLLLGGIGPLSPCCFEITETKRGEKVSVHF